MSTAHPALGTRRALFVLAAVGQIVMLATAAFAQSDPAVFFKQNCASCHTIGGGRLTGPDLKDVTARRDRAWLLRYLPNPQTVIDSGDPYAAQLVRDARGVIMPSVAGLTPAVADGLISLIEAESRIERSRFAGAQISDRPFTVEDIARGRRLFRGELTLTAGGPPCISCHTLKGVAALGGGRLGPDLTKVYERLQGRKGLGTWLSAPATPTMQSVFANKPFSSQDILPLVAYFESSARQGGQDVSIGSVQFLLLGMGCSVVGLVAFDRAWRTRLRAVRRVLVESCRIQEVSDEERDDHVDHRDARPKAPFLGGVLPEPLAARPHRPQHTRS